MLFTLVRSMKLELGAPEDDIERAIKSVPHHTLPVSSSPRQKYR